MRTVAIAALCVFALVACKSARKWETGSKTGASTEKTMVEPAMAEPAMRALAMAEPAMKEPAMAAAAMKEPAMAEPAMKSTMGPPKRPKSHAKGHTKCLTCHKVGGGVKAMPKNHKGRSQSICKACHRQSK